MVIKRNAKMVYRLVYANCPKLILNIHHPAKELWGLG